MKSDLNVVGHGAKLRVKWH